MRATVGIFAVFAIVSQGRAQLGDPNAWRSDFPADHASDAAIEELASYGGSLYVAGEFEFIDNQSMPGFGRFDGANWSAANTPGVAIRRMEASSFGLIAIGEDDQLYSFDGNVWQPLPDPAIGSPRDLLELGGELIVASDSAIQSWNGNSWSSLAAFGTRVLAAYQGQLVAGGGYGAPGIFAIYDALAQSWSGVGTQLERKDWDFAVCFDPYPLDAFTLVPANVRCMVEWNGELVIGGSFHLVDGVDGFVDVARWNGSQWQPLTLMPDGSCTYYSSAEYWSDSTVIHLSVFGSELWGITTAAGPDTPYALRRLDAPGGTITPLCEGARDLAEFGGSVYVGGSSLATDVFGIGEVQGSSVVAAYLSPASEAFRSTMGYAFDGEIHALENATGKLFRWNESNSKFAYTGYAYSSPCNEQNCTVYPLIQEDMTYFQGAIRTVGQGNVAGFWQESYGDGAAQHALEIYDGQMVIGGRLVPGGPSLAVTTASFPGPVFATLGSPTLTVTEFDGQGVHDFAKFGALLVAGGDFFLGATRMPLAQWDGNAWSAFPVQLENGGAAAVVRELVVFQGELIAFGDFSQAGATPLPGAARWDGAQWQPLAAFDVVPKAAYASPTHLIVGGAFQDIDGQNIAHLAVFDGLQWSEFAGGVDGPVDRILPLNGGLFLLGQFRQAGNVDSQYMAWYPSAPELGLEPLGFDEFTIAQPDLDHYDLHWNSDSADEVYRDGSHQALGAANGELLGLTSVPILVAQSERQAMRSDAQALGSGLTIETFSVFPRVLTGTQSQTQLDFASLGADRTRVYRGAELLFDSTSQHAGSLDVELLSFPETLKLVVENAWTTQTRESTVFYSATPGLAITTFQGTPEVLIGNQQQVTVEYFVTGATELEIFQDGLSIFATTNNFSGNFPAVVPGESALFELWTRGIYEEQVASFQVTRSPAVASIFEAIPNPVLVGSTSVIEWGAIGNFTSLQLNGEEVSQFGTREVVVAQDSDFVFDVIVDGEIIDQRQLTLIVDNPDFAAGPAIGLSSLANSYDPTLLAPPLTPLTAYVLASGLSGGAAAADFSLMLPPGLYLTGFTPAPGISRFGLGSDFGLSWDSCSGEGLLLLGTLSFFATEEIPQAEILLAGSPASLLSPKGVSYNPCATTPWVRIAGLPMLVNSEPPVPTLPSVIVQTELLGSHPNPFNPSTTIRWSQARAGAAELSIFNLQGALVWSEHHGWREVGIHETKWTGVDNAGRSVSSGSYLLRLQSAGVVDSRRLLLLK